MLEPTILVVFGLTGDLAKRKLLPALYHLTKANLLHEQTVIVGVTRRDVTTDEVLQDVELCIREKDGICDPEAVAKLRERIQMFKMNLTSGEDYGRLHQALDGIENRYGVCMNRLYYLSIPPQVYSPIVRLLGEHGLNQSCQHNQAQTRLLVEKPFGYDLASAKELVEATGKHFQEDQIYRIDHYLAKETVQNILAFRSENPLFEQIWNSEHICQIQITASESIGIEDRAVFYEQTGALRDLIQSHLLQVMALVTMELPQELSSEHVHAAKEALLRATQSPDPFKGQDNSNELEAIRGQYEGYTDEVQNPDSQTETYAAIKMRIDTDTWRGTDVVLRTGKALAKKATAVSVVFRPPVASNGQKPLLTGKQNVLTFRIQPDEGISLDLRVRRPGYDTDITSTHMEFSYDRHLSDDTYQPDAYERVFVDAVRGDRTLFATSEEVLESWRIVEPVLHAWLVGQATPPRYVKGSDGPAGNEAIAGTWLL